MRGERLEMEVQEESEEKLYKVVSQTILPSKSPLPFSYQMCSLGCSWFWRGLCGSDCVWESLDRDIWPALDLGRDSSSAPQIKTHQLDPQIQSSSMSCGAQTDSTTRSNPAEDARLPPVGGLGLPEMFGSTQDTASLSQFMQNPAVSQMMQSLLSNPQYMNQILGLNSQQSNMLGSNSQLREMMQNPEFIRQLTSPETMQSTHDFTANSFVSAWLATINPGSMSNRWGNRELQKSLDNCWCGTLDNMGLEMLMNMFGGLGIGSPAVPVRSDVPPEELYATQLSQLQEMGFFDTRENLQALIATVGNVHAAVERLLGNPVLAEAAKAQFSRDCSDNLALVRAYEAWKEAERDVAGYEYCWKNFLFAQSMKVIDAL
ncbi:unnamed protein product [Camellia sinensis]